MYRIRVMISTFDKHLCRFCLYMYKDHDCTLFGAREERQLGSLRRQRIVLRLADALIVTDSPLVIRVENMVTTSTLEVSEVDLNGIFSWLCWFYRYFLHFSSPDNVDPINV